MHAMQILSPLMLFVAYGAIAAPTDRVDANKGLTVLLRREDGSFDKSDDMLAAVQFRRASALLSKRQASAIVEACTSIDCTGCSTKFSGTLQSSTGCINVTGTNCLVISNLQSANIQYWSGAQCSGRHTSYGVCQNLVPVGVPAPNTNSLAVQTGCL